MPFSIMAINDVSINGLINFELLTADTAVLTNVVASAGGLVTSIDVQSNYLDITLDNTSTITLATTGAGNYFNVVTAPDIRYSATLNCPPTNLVLTGLGAQIIVRVQVITTYTPCPGGGGGRTAIYPSINSFVINNNVSTTSSNSVTISMDVQNAVQVAISNDSGFIGAVWEPFTSPMTKSWTLESGSGTKTVYALFKSSTGDLSNVISDSIEVIEGEITPPPVTPPVIPPVIPPVVPPTGSQCAIDCSGVTYDLYIINPDGSERHLGSDFVKVNKIAENVYIYSYEDDGGILDYNDVNIRVDKSDCNKIIVTVLSENSAWTHQVKIRLFYNAFALDDILLWSNSKIAIGQISVIDLGTYTELCSAEVALKSGDLIKGSLDTVYYYGADGKRYIFPSRGTYMSWYPDFSGVKHIGDSQLAKIPLGAFNVTYKPGVRMLKIQSLPDVYAVDQHGTLRWVVNEDAARALYGPDWNTKIDDLSDAFFVNYVLGDNIYSLADFNPIEVANAVTSINFDKNI